MKTFTEVLLSSVGCRFALAPEIKLLLCPRSSTSLGSADPLATHSPPSQNLLYRQPCRTPPPKTTSARQEAELNCLVFMQERVPSPSSSPPSTSFCFQNTHDVFSPTQGLRGAGTEIPPLLLPPPENHLDFLLAQTFIQSRHIAGFQQVLLL